MSFSSIYFGLILFCADTASYSNCAANCRIPIHSCAKHERRHEAVHQLWLVSIWIGLGWMKFVNCTCCHLYKLPASSYICVLLALQQFMWGGEMLGFVMSGIFLRKTEAGSDWLESVRETQDNSCHMMCWRLNCKSVVRPTVSTNHVDDSLVWTEWLDFCQEWPLGTVLIQSDMPEWSMAWQRVGKMQMYTSWHGDSSLISVSEKLPDWSRRWTCWCCFFAFYSFAWSYVNHVSGRTTDKDCWVLPAQPKQWQAATWTQIASSGWWLLQVDVSCPSRV